MTDKYEKDLPTLASLDKYDYVRIVGTDGTSYKNLVADLAKTIIENYTGSLLDGKNQSVKDAITNFRFHFDTGTVPGTTVTARSYVDVPVTFHRPFASVPTVVAMVLSESLSGDIGRVNVAIVPNTITKLGVTLRLFNAGAGDRIPGIKWIATDA